MLAAAVAVLAVVTSLPVLLRLLSARGGGEKKTPPPPGPFRLPFVGHTLSLVRALHANTADDWLRRCVAAYGPVSRLSLFGSPTAFLSGTSANKFIFGSAAVTAKNPESLARMIGRRTIREVVGDEHRRVRAMMVQFLRTDVVKRYVATMDDEVRRHLDADWRGRGTVAVMTSTKALTFDVMCTVIFGLGRDATVRRELWTEFQQLVKGIFAVPVNLPFTTYSRCLAASERGRRAVAGVIQERRAKLERGERSPGDDVVTLMLAEGMPDDDIIDNVMFLIIAAHDTTAALLTFLIRQLDIDKDVFDKVVQEQEEIARSKAPGEALSWDDLGRMRYTWAAAMETLRMYPPVYSMTRKTLDDVEYGGYLIPKGWQVMHMTTMTHSDPAIFPDPGRFDPARFENPAAVPPFAFVPFGGGARLCPGNEFARVETLVALHYIVTRFRWKLAAGCDLSFSRFPLPYPSQGLLIDIEPIQK
ncbi:hypothetical protein U9M48_026462 [Paspalum notatum var. saurae]|uniref:Cytochrome P450 n=1 Tax=Paspalum notatum var. saurae TaxID=547442 RepID=A0AAQ3TXH1_PASNO